MEALSKPIMGDPDRAKICTSHVRTPESHDSNADAPHDAADERFQQEVGKPMGCLWFAFYNFCRIHQTLRVMAGYGRGNHGSRLGTGGTTGVKRAGTFEKATFGFSLHTILQNISEPSNVQYVLKNQRFGCILFTQLKVLSGFCR